MASLKRIEAARRNGARSHGPVTLEGRAASSRNSLKHGITSEKMFVLGNESVEIFDKLVASIVAQYAPATDLEHELCIDIAHARWRMRRLWTTETALYDLELDKQDKIIREAFAAFDEGTRLACVFRELAREAGPLPLLTVYETRLRRAFDRAVHRLEKLQEKRKNEPKETSPLAQAS